MFGGGENEKDGIGMDMMSMIQDMPLLSILDWGMHSLSVPADDLVDIMLGQAHGAKE